MEPPANFAEVESVFTWSQNGEPGDPVTINPERYLSLLNSIGAKALGLLTFLVMSAEVDADSGMKVVSASQEEIGTRAAGGDSGWSQAPTRELLDVLLRAGLLAKVPSRALGRNRGSSAPKWIVLPDTRVTQGTANNTLEIDASNVGGLSKEVPTMGRPKTVSPIKPSTSSRIGRPDFGGLKLATPHVMDGRDSIHSSNDDNALDDGLLAAAVTQALARLGWIDSTTAVEKFGAQPLAAWIAVSGDRDNPGGFVRAQTKKEVWPVYPKEWNPGVSEITLGKDGQLLITTKGKPDEHRALPRPLTAIEILELFESAGDAGKAAKKVWLEEVDKKRYSSPEERSRKMQEIGARLIALYGIPCPRQETKTA